jgi:hypothetical protein
MSKSKLNEMQNLVSKETSRVIEELLGPLFSSEDELQRQKSTASRIDARGSTLRAKKNGGEPVNQQKEADEEGDAKPASKSKPEAKPMPSKEEKPAAKPVPKPEEEKGGKGGGTAGSDKFATPEPEELSNPSFDKFKEALALLRGGHSASDADVSKALQNYYDRELDPQDRQKIYAFFFGVAQILSKVVSSKEAMDPEMLQKMTGGSSARLEPAKSEPEKKAVSTLPGGPIIVGEAQRKDAVLEILRDSKP